MRRLTSWVFALAALLLPLVLSSGSVDGTPRCRDFACGRHVSTPPTQPNLVNNCDTFNALGWTDFGGSGGTGPTFGSAVADPNGLVDASQVGFTDPRSGFYQTITPGLALNQQYTARIYFKSISGTPDFYLSYYNGANPSAQYSAKIIPTGSWQLSPPFTFTTGINGTTGGGATAGTDPNPSISIENANVDGASQGNVGTAALWGLKVEPGAMATAFTGCVSTPPPGGTRTALIGMFMDVSTVPSVPVHNWLGYLPDLTMNNQGLNPGFPTTNPGGQGANAYPWVLSLDIAQAYGTDRSYTYANVASGSKDTAYQSVLNALTSSDKASIYAVRLDHEFEAWSTAGCAFCGGTPEFVSEGATVDIAAWRHLACVIKAILPNAKVIWNPGGTSIFAPFDYTSYYPGGAGSCIDHIGTDGGYFQADTSTGGQPRDFQVKFGVTAAQSSDPATYSSAPAGTLAWFINFAKTAAAPSGGSGVPFDLCEWGDEWQKTPPDGSGATGANITLMAAVINNPANNIGYAGYWNSNDCCGAGVDLSAIGQAAFAAAWGSHTGAPPTYTGTALAPHKTPPAAGFFLPACPAGGCSPTGGGTEVY